MGADLGGLFQHTDADVLAALGGQLLQADGRRQPGRPAADDDDVVFHRFTFSHGSGFPLLDERWTGPDPAIVRAIVLQNPVMARAGGPPYGGQIACSTIFR